MTNPSTRLTDRAADVLSAGARGFSRWTGGVLSAYAEYLARISWWRFFLLALLGLIAAAILKGVLPSMSGSVKIVEERAPGPIKLSIRPGGDSGDVEVRVDPVPRGKGATTPQEDADAQEGSGDAAPDEPAAGPRDRVSVKIGREGIRVESREGRGKSKVVVIDLKGIQVQRGQDSRPSGTPAGAAAEGLALEPIPPLAPLPPQADRGAADAWVAATNRRIAEANERIAAAQGNLPEVLARVASGVETAVNRELDGMKVRRVERTHRPDLLIPLYMIFVFASAIIKVVGADRRRAVARAGAAEAEAEREILRRQLLEARLQAMQAQVEPHFLFNTLASVEYLIETEPVRAGGMLKSLIRYLRAALPRMREQSTTLGQEAELVRAYLEILEYRMEERLNYRINVPVGLASAQFPPMMLQSVVENSIKHGLEPKPEGGSVALDAAVADGDLVVTVTDTGLGLGLSPAAGSGLGLSNLRERMHALYGGRGSFVIESIPAGGTVVRMQIPYAAAARAERLEPAGNVQA